MRYSQERGMYIIEMTAAYEAQSVVEAQLGASHLNSELQI